MSATLSGSFSAVNMIHLEDGTLSESARHERLRALVAGQLDEMQLIRQDHGLLINANHLVALFQSAFHHFAEEISQPFHFVKATRAYNDVPPSLATNLVHYQEMGCNLVFVMKISCPLLHRPSLWTITFPGC